MMRLPSLVLLAMLAASVVGCQVEDLLASDFKKFTKCVENTSKDGLVQKGIAKQVCAAKYSTPKKVEIDATGKFSWCSAEPCGMYEINGLNKSTKAIITGLDITVVVNGRSINGRVERLWFEPGTAVSVWATLDSPATQQERTNVSWFVREVRGIDIDG
jgi:hypothetical protein